MKLQLTLFFILIQISFIYCQSDKISNQLIGIWYLSNEKNDTLIFDKKSNLYDLKIMDKKNISLTFHSLDSVGYRLSILDSNTFEEHSGYSGYSWNYNPQSKLILSDLATQFNTQKLELISISESELKILKIDKMKKASSQQ